MVKITFINGKTITISKEGYEKGLKLTYFWVEEEIISSCGIVKVEFCQKDNLNNKKEI